MRTAGKRTSRSTSSLHHWAKTGPARAGRWPYLARPVPLPRSPFPKVSGGPMNTRWSLGLIALMAAPGAALPHRGAAAPRSPSPPPVQAAPAEAKQFDFLVGEWEVVVRPKV